MLSSRPVSYHSDVPTKTPGRSLVKGRNGRQENSTHQAPFTMNTRGQKVLNSQTPFQPKTLQSTRLFKDSTDIARKPTTTITTSATVSRPFNDKTPFPNRVAQSYHTPPQPHTKLSFTEVPKSQLNVGPRPSSTRRHIRLPRSASRSFETPVNRGNHWDVSIGDVSVAVSEQSVEEGADYDEVEYMPPHTEVPYEPPFDFELPDYKVLGSNLLRVMHACPLNETPVVLDDFECADSEMDVNWNLLTLPELEDDSPFARHKKSAPPKSIKRATAVPSSRPTSRPPTASRTTISTRTAFGTSRPSSRPASVINAAPRSFVSRVTAANPSNNTRSTPATLARGSIAPSKASKNPSTSILAVGIGKSGGCVRAPLDRKVASGSRSISTTVMGATTSMRIQAIRDDVSKSIPASASAKRTLPLRAGPHSSALSTRAAPTLSRGAALRPSTKANRDSKARPSSCVAEQPVNDDLVLAFEEDGEGMDGNFMFDI